MSTAYRFVHLMVVSAALCGSPAAAASECDAARIAAQEIAAMRDSRPQEGVARGNAALATLRTGGQRCPHDEARLLGAIGNNLNILGRNAEAADHFAEALTLAGDMPATLRASLHRGAGLASYDIGDFEAAIEHYLASLAASEDADDELEAAKTAANLGILYVSLGLLDNARDYHERALRGFESVGWREGIAGSLVNLGALAARVAATAAEAGDAAAAALSNQQLRAYNERALALFRELGNLRGVSYAASNVGLAYDRLDDPSSALEYHELALQARREVGDERGVINSLVSMAASLTLLGRYADAEAHLTEAESLLPPGNPRLRISVIEPWAALDEARGDLAQALARQRELARLRVEIAADDFQVRAAEIQARYDTEQQQRAIDELRFATELADLRLARQRAWLVTGVIVVAVLVLVVFALIGWQRVTRKHSQEVERAARTDELTGLANRRGVRERIEYEIRRSRRSGRPFALAVLDIDEFKAVNDAYGHAAGDQALVEIARRVERELRDQDTVARWGGDELLLLLPETDEAGAAALARKVAGAVTATPIAHGTAESEISLTIGVSQYWPGRTLDECLRAADETMYRGKKTGKNQVVTSRDETIPRVPDP